MHMEDDSLTWQCSVTVEIGGDTSSTKIIEQACLEKKISNVCTKWCGEL